MEKFYLFIIFAVPFVTALEPYDNFKEGACNQFKGEAVKANREFIDSLKYLAAGSKYHRYRTISHLPNYKSMREDEFFYDSCMTRNTTTAYGPALASLFGFGDLISTWKATPKNGTYAEFNPVTPSNHPGTVVQIVTLTDHKTFAFLTDCWTADDQMGWNVVTNTPNINLETEKAIEEHAVSSGFKREYFYFTRYDSCRRGGPIVYDNYYGSLGWSF